jgi:hypothetical protein
MDTLKGCIEILGKIKAMMAKDLGAELGEAEYYRVLKHHGAEHANSFKRLDKAKVAARDMLMILEGAKQQPAPAAQLEPLADEAEMARLTREAIARENEEN